jgi:competence protein ComEC
MLRRGKNPAPERRNCRVLRIAFLLTVVAAAGFVLDGFYWGYQRFWTDKLKITIIDVGHGNAGLLEIPGGEVILIDGGGFSDNSVYDVGRRIVAPLLWRKKIRTVQTLILSHPNSDHLNGLIYIARRFHVKRLISNGEPADTRGYEEMTAVVREKGIQMPDYEDMERSWSTEGVTIDIPYPAPGFLEKRSLEPWRDENNNSLVVKVSLEGVSFLFPGDIETEGENELVEIAGDDLQSRVLVASHHGSRTSSTQPFLKAVNPEIIVVSSGYSDRYGALRPEVSERYQRLGAQVFTTPEHGAVTFITDGETLWVETTAE